MLPKMCEHRTGVKLSSTHLNIKDYSVHSRLILFHSLMRDVARSKQSGFYHSIIPGD